MKNPLPLPAWIVAGTIVLGGTTYYLVQVPEGPTVPQPTQTHEPQPSPSHEPTCNPPASTEKRCSSTVTCDCWESADDCIWHKVPPVAAPGPECDATLTCGCWKPDGPCKWDEVPAPAPPGPVCDANLACGCWKQASACEPWVEVPAIGPAPGPVCNANVICDCWEQQTSCSPWTKRPACPTPPPPTPPPPTPSPGVCQWGKDIEGKCLPEPPKLTGNAYPDDPKGLLREGFGKDTKGGSGSQKILITALGPDNEAAPVAGTLRWAFAQINATHRIVECDPNLTGTITLNTPLYWKKPWTTLDLSACDVEIKASKPAQNAVVITAVYEFILYSPRGAGWFAGGGPTYVQPNNSGVFAIDGDGGPIQYPWDTEWNTTPAQLKRGVRRFIIDRASISNCEDDALNTWEATRQGTISRSFVHDCFHPSTTGAKGAPLPAYRERIWVSHLYNVFALNGERNVMLPRREAYWIHAGGNILWHWKEYTSKVCKTVDTTGKCTQWVVEQNFPIGISIETDAPRENDYIFVNGNCFIGGAEGGTHKLWGCGIAGVTCENAVKCCAPNCSINSGRDFECCNPGMQGNHWALKGNFGDYGECMRNNPKDWTPPQLPYEMATVPFATVLDNVGAVRRRPAEQALLDQIKAELGRCNP